MNYILSPDKEIHSFDGVLANDSDTEEGSCGFARKACADWWAGKLYHLTKMGKVQKRVFLNMFLVSFCLYPESYHFIFPDFKNRT